MVVSITAVGPVGCGDTFTWALGESGKSDAAAGGEVCCSGGGAIVARRLQKSKPRTDCNCGKVG